MPIAHLRNASLNYLFEGPTDAPVIVLSNSLGTEMSMWNSQMAGLIQHFQVLRYDTRGHGGSRAAGGVYSLSELGGDVLELLDLLAIVQFHVCGISLGGMTALWLAIYAPDRVLSAMPCNTAARIGSDSSWNARIKQVATHGLASIADATMQRWFTPWFREHEPAKVEATRQMFLRTHALGYLACCAALRDADFGKIVCSIAAPTTVVSGTHDPVTPPPDGHFLAQSIPKARYCELDAAHLSNLEQPAAFLQIMMDLIQKGR